VFVKHSLSQTWEHLKVDFIVTGREKYLSLPLLCYVNSETLMGKPNLLSHLIFFCLVASTQVTPKANHLGKKTNTEQFGK